MKQFNLADLVNPPNTDSISGRDFGVEYAKKINLLELVSKEDKIEFLIDDTKVKAINDSFIKGLFNEVFARYKKIVNIQVKISVIANEHFKRLFFKNWKILENIYNV